LQAWASVPPQGRALLELFLDASTVVVDHLGAAVASRADVRAYPAYQAGLWDIAGANLHCACNYDG